MEKQLYLFYKDESQFLGTLFIADSKGKEIYSFEYSGYALKNDLSNIVVDPEISFIRGRQYKSDSSLPYVFLKDLAPDRWGQNLIKRKLQSKNVFFSDYLMNVSDDSRMGAIRIKSELNGPFILQDNNIPPYKYIRELEDAAYNYDDFSDYDSWKILLAPGSSLGGARPKCTIYNNNHELYLAKFGHKNDDYDVSKIEYMTYLLAKDVGLNISDSSLIGITSKRSVFLTKRFDRKKDERIHYLSMMTLMNVSEGDSNLYSYLDVAETIKKISVSPNDDLKELFKRVAFYIFVHNYDDHLRNIGMIYEKGFRLSPLFDVNIVFYNSHITVSIDGSEDYSLKNLISKSKYFNINNIEAEKILFDMKEKLLESLIKHSSLLKIESNIFKRIESFIKNS